MAFRPSIPKLLPSADGKTFGIRGWRVFGPGLWNGKPLTPARIAATVDTYRNLKSLIPNYAPKLRLGHDTQQRLAKQLGLTNAGRVIDARLTPDHGIDVDIDGISLTALMTDGKGGFLAFDLEAAIRNGNYDGGLIEMKRQLRQLRHPLDPTQTKPCSTCSTASRFSAKSTRPSERPGPPVSTHPPTSTGWLSPTSPRTNPWICKRSPPPSPRSRPTNSAN